MSKVSIVMPIYNTDEFLEQSIDSVLKQSYQNYELLLINDNSTDKSQRIINEFALLDDRIKIFRFTENRGVGAARNFGVNQATGDYIYFLDSDDYLGDSTLQLLIDNINDYDLISGKLIHAHLNRSMDDEEDEINEEVENEEKIGIELKFYKDSKKYNLIKNKSALNRLFKRKYIIEHKLRFSEDVQLYSDLSFIVPALFNTEVIPYLKDSQYYKRKRNDPISNPALMQISIELKIKDFLEQYNYLKDHYLDKNIQLFLDKQLLNFYRKSVIRFFRKSKNIDKVFFDLANSFKRIDSDLVDNIGIFTKREVKALRKGNKKKFIKLSVNHNRARNIRNAFKGRRRLYIQLYRTLFLKLPMRKKTIVFESFLGKSYSDSPKYIYEYMVNNKMDYQYIWIFNEKKEIPGNALQVKRFSIGYFYYLARSKYWVSNSRLPIALNKRKGNIYLQTWHGTPLKQLVFDMNDIYSADPKYKSNFYKQSRRWDYLSSPNEYSSEIFRRAFKYEKELLEFGYPRNDILYEKNNINEINHLKERMQLPTNKKIVLYAPTWRDDEFYSRGKYKFTLKLELDKLQQELGDEYIVLLRMHYFIANQLDIKEYDGFVYDFSSYDDIAELYLVSDILITDYSSVFFDYAHLKRPILFYTYDLENYRDKLRGFYIDIENEAPGPLLRTTEDIIDSIININDINKEFDEKYDAFYTKFCSWDNGDASKKTVDAVFNNN